MQVQELEFQVASVPARAEAQLVRTAEEYGAAAELLKHIKSLRGEINDTFDPIIAKQYSAHREAIAQKKKHDDPLERAEQLLKPRMSGYIQEQEKLRKQEELRLDKIAREKDEQSRLEYADVLHDVGLVEEANRVLAEPVPVTPVVLPRSTPKVAGITSTATYSAQMVDMKAFLTAILAGKVPMMAVSANMVFLNQQARSLKESFNVPGVKLNTATNIAARRF